MVDREDIEDRLRRIEAVTDATLAHLSTETLYDELLARIRELLVADTATVLLLDRSGRQLVATAAVGIEEEVRQGVRIPIGQGFAGRIAATREPLVIDHIDASTVVNPLLWEHGLHTLAGVPLIVAGSLLGVLHVGTVRPHDFTDEDLHLLQMVADRLALAAHTHVSMVERTAARALQLSLLPTVLPTIPGLSFSGRYIPAANDVGGDWYDVFPLPGDRVGIVMGDVVGHGLPAAVVMGRLRSALRAYALDIDDPGEVLRKLDRKATHFEAGALATVSYAVVDADREHATIALAGHPPPILAEPDGTVTLARQPVGAPIGFHHDPGHRYPSTVLALRPGAVLCFFTDGLVERRDSTIDVGLAQLCDAVLPAAPEAVCARVMSRLVGTRPAQDDIALLVVRREPTP
ncbi:MAG TPA: GAF domain-containing SpoIIE family protein phosphatase [Pseudonocardiaceae bacterium]|nr:GAF domain-containing SpoIIE family protein phosphatase [Pseudonocardiaceae bacterium]